MNFMQPAVCLLPVIPMRKEPSHRSEMVSQVLFGEYVLTGEKKDDFVLVKCDYDGYEGWVQAKQFVVVDKKDILQPDAYTAGFATTVAKNDALLYVPYGTPVFMQSGYSFSIGNLSFNYLLQPQQTWKVGEHLFSPETLAAVYQPYLNAPYLWGGKSVYGIDCSGFVQQAFKFFGIKLLRDAYLQAEQGVDVASLADVKLGDLAFFRNEKGRITHVGILLDDRKIVHASGEVRVDAVTETGIINRETGKQTHEMHSIRRFAFQKTRRG